MAETATRTRPLQGRAFSGNGIDIIPAPDATRLSLRAPSASLGALSKALGVKLPEKPKTSASKGARHALWLGPDEWLVIDEGEADLIAACAKASALHSAVDVSHRNAAILISGAGVEDVLAAGCPQDLSLGAFPVGAATRTVFGKVEIVLHRTAGDAFRVEVWRSFSDYAFTLMEDAARDVAR
jgi:sarcosine oxidase, subunit gamma